MMSLIISNGVKPVLNFYDFQKAASIIKHLKILRTKNIKITCEKQQQQNVPQITSRLSSNFHASIFSLNFQTMYNLDRHSK